MKIIIIALLVSYCLQLLINLCIAIYNCNYKGATIGDVVEEMKLFNWPAWIPVLGFIIQIVFLVYLLISNLWKKLKKLRIR